MKKSILITILISIILTIIVGVFLTSRTKKNVEKEEFDYDYICSYETSMIDDEDEYSDKIKKNLYLKVDENDYVISAIYESIYKNELFSNSLRNLTQDIVGIYNGMEGIETNIKSDKANSYVTIKYDYDKINFKELKNNLKELLDEDSIQYKMNNKIKVEDYIKESKEYTCTKK